MRKSLRSSAQCAAIAATHYTQLKNGGLSINLYCLKFFNYNMKTDLVIAGYIIHQNKVLLIHHRKLNLWLPVGGHIDENETPDQALLREIKEEISIDVEILNQSDMPTLNQISLRHSALMFIQLVTMTIVVFSMFVKP